MPAILTRSIPRNAPAPSTAGAGPRAKYREPEQEHNPLACPVCNRVCASKLGLASHMRSHAD